MEARLVIFALLCVIGFFNYHNAVPEVISRASYMLVMLIMGVYALKNGDVKLKKIEYPRFLWLIFGLGMVTSICMAQLYHFQSIRQTAVTESTMIMSYCSFFILLKLSPKEDQVIKLMYVLLGLQIVVYLANFATFPHNMFGPPILSDLSRGVLRIRMPLLSVIVLLNFYSINKWQITRNPYYVGAFIVCMIMVVLSVTRTAILMVAILSFLQFLQGFTWFKKIILGAVIALSGYFIMINLPMYQDMKEVSEAQIDATQTEEKEDVRIGAWRYYGYGANESVVTFLFGNGLPSLGKSAWGRHIDSFTEETGYFIADVSWAGMIFIFGLIPTLSLFIIVVLSISKQKIASQRYLSYYMIYVLVRGFASGVWFFSEEIFITMIVLYLIYKGSSINDRKDIIESVVNNRRTFVVN